MEPKGRYRRFGAALNAAVLASGRQKQAVAEAAGIHRACLSEWCCGHALPAPGMWQRAAAAMEALGIDTAPVVLAIADEYRGPPV